jgi:hypothetical protein
LFSELNARAVYSLKVLKNALMNGVPIIAINETKKLEAVGNKLPGKVGVVQMIEIVGTILNNPIFYLEYSKRTQEVLCRLNVIDSNIFAMHYYDIVLIDDVPYMKLDYPTMKYFAGVLTTKSYRDRYVTQKFIRYR